MQYLSPLDASFLDAEDEDPHASLAIASIAVMDGPAPSQTEFADLIRSRLPLVPRYRQKVRRIPFNLGPPIWADDPDFDLDFHLRRTALPAPGDDAALEQLVSRIMAQRLDRERPLWEDWLIEGLPDGRWALLSKVHHCLLDGIGGNELYRLICDTGPGRRPPPDGDWTPQPADSALELTLDACAQLARLPFDQARLLLRTTRPAGLAGRLHDTLRGLVTLAEGFTPTAPTSLFGPLGRARRYAVARTPLARIAAVAKAAQVTVNDVYLAAVTGAFRELLLARGEEPVSGAVRTLVPVSLRTRDQEGVLDNRLAPLLLDLPVEIGNPHDRLAVVHQRIGELRARHEVEAGAALVSLARWEPYAVVSFVVRTGLWLPQRAVTTVTTNVPGPRGRLFILGRPIREILPYVPIAERMRIGVAVLTYAGQATIGVTTDFASIPEAGEFAASIVTEVSRLQPATSVAAAPAARHRVTAARRNGDTT
ncbi:wax ester/triacylglycerol synthase family O-acyltransferase [Actinoplanes xinjiangensis]|uniref:Diacylglycerol O-acyltransferase n=1 Tax=Actinoplanes xinjiangensis TaxID=512350 RepID=A0A316EC88_9ACTN|nr:wax ester/triacylglycerol synthase family O-acyltransferase [Actinoplanes xinjiangensis]PWK26980.1 diacylglycerol O-acyltransferase [Actinoplanes xinjiangensis]GIF45340.1 diacylglycerol O-acyltransferase [Actinoplanes xinjiangensis]